MKNSINKNNFEKFDTRECLIYAIFDHTAAD